MRFRFLSIVRWVYHWWHGWRPVNVPPPAGAAEANEPRRPIRYRALVAAAPPSHAKRPKGPSSLQRRALKRRARLQSLRTP